MILRICLSSSETSGPDPTIALQKRLNADDVGIQRVIGTSNLVQMFRPSELAQAIRGEVGDFILDISTKPEKRCRSTNAAMPTQLQSRKNRNSLTRKTRRMIHTIRNRGPLHMYTHARSILALRPSPYATPKPLTTPPLPFQAKPCYAPCTRFPTQHYSRCTHMLHSLAWFILTQLHAKPAAYDDRKAC